VRGSDRKRPEAAALTRRQAGAVLGLVALLFALQLPRVVLTGAAVDRASDLAGLAGELPRVLWTGWGDECPEQQAALRRIEAVDARCRQYRIAAATAREAMNPGGERPLDIPGCDGREDGWEFLRGSDDPDPTITPGQARRLLEGEGP
jgi:hypothetical protein